MEDLGRGRPAEDFERQIVDLGDELVGLYLGGVFESDAVRKVFANPAVEVLVRAALPGGVRVGEIGRDSEGVCDLVVLGALAAVVGRHGRDRVCGQRLVNPICASTVALVVGPGRLAACRKLELRSTVVFGAPVPRTPSTLSDSQYPNWIRSSTAAGRSWIKVRPLMRLEWTFRPERLQRLLWPPGKYCHNWRCF